MNLSETIEVQDKFFTQYIGKYELNSILQDLSRQINNKYKDIVNKNDPLIIIGILNGSFMFLTDLVKLLDIHCEIEFIKVSSYIGTETSGKITDIIGLNKDVTNKNILIVEDIVDTGLTMINIIEKFKSLNPKNIEICTLLHKVEKTVNKVQLHYVGKVIKDKFVVGYGLDYNGQGRNLDCIYSIV